MNWKEDSLHTNHRRKKGRHNPNRVGPGWRWPYIHWAIKAETKAKRRAKDRHLMVTGRYDDLLTHIPKVNLWLSW